MKTQAILCKAILCLLCVITTLQTFSQTTIIAYGSTWKYLDNNTRPANWNQPAPTFNDGTWASGPSELGYGDAPVTTVSYGPDPNNKYISTYFRQVVNIPAPASYTNFTLNVRRDDGIVIYVNGTERVRDNMPGGGIVHGTLASTAAADDGATPQTFTLSSAFFTPGNNTIAVEVHQNAVTSTDLTFDLELLGNLAPTLIINMGDSWKYWANTAANAPAGTWKDVGYPDGAWTTAGGEFGYGDGDEVTCVPSGGGGTICVPTGNKWTTTYFRKTFNVTGLSSINTFTINLLRDDGAVVYVNGIEVIRDNMPAPPTTYTTFASSALGAPAESTPVVYTIPRCAFVEGSNTIAVEVHQSDLTSSDLSFNLSLGSNAGGGTPNLTRGPYLQAASETAITVRWRTNIACVGRVNVGTAVGTYTTATADESCPTTEHIIRVTGLAADTKYWYQIAATDGTIFQGGAANFFTSNPPATTTRKIRIAAFGDCGRNSAVYQDNNLANYQTYLTANGIDAPDAWLLMGDNAYSTGSEAEYTSNFFNIYGGNILKNHKMYPAPGNHDYGNNAANKPSRSMPYHNNFTVPQDGESGGVASNHQNFYSFDLGNIHFISIDAYGTESDGTDIGTAGTSMLKTWLTADLAANTKKWVIAYWHHPPYTKSSHNSDSEADLVAIRQNFIGFLETRGVDLIICGHSHAYERGYLIKNFTGTWTSFTPATHAVSMSSATYQSAATCPYVYNTSPANHGTVYVVSGSVGASGGTNAGFAANGFPFAVNDAGIFYFEVEDNRLDAKFLRQNGTIFDRFTIMKDVNKTNNYNIANGASITLNASWPAATPYTWNLSPATTRSINVTPPASTTTNYTVTDQFGCVTDQFSVTTSTILPVSLLSFEARLVDGKANLTWSTSTESNNNYFTVERSSNGADYTEVSRVNGAGNSTEQRNYLLVDPAPLPGTSFYRLSQTNFDAHREYLGVRRIDNNLLKDFDVKTLSGTAGKLTLQITSSVQGTYNLNIFDLSGRRVKTEVFNMQIGVLRKEVALAPGMYIWEIRNEKGDAMLQKVLVQ